MRYRYSGILVEFYLATVLHALCAVHHNVYFGVGPSTTDVPCHNLNFVHNTCRVQLHARLSVSVSGSLRLAAPGSPRGATLEPDPQDLQV